MEQPTQSPLQPHEALESNKPVSEPAASPNSNKRKSDNGEFINSEYSKLRSLVKDLRPFFMEAIHTPDFRESKAADEIRKRMNIMMELTKQLTETASTLKPNKVIEQQLNGAVMKENANKKVELKKQSKEQPTGIPPAAISSRIENVGGQKGDEKSTAKFGGEGLSRGSFVVGGSPIGWNFLLYPGSKPFYYGRTKESVLAARASNK